MNRMLPPGDCGRQIAASRRHPDIEGLRLGLEDWSGSMRLLQAAHGLAPVAPQSDHVCAAGGCPVCSGRATTTAEERQESGSEVEKPAGAEAGRAEEA
jgi:hypothetical protein